MAKARWMDRILHYLRNRDRPLFVGTYRGRIICRFLWCRISSIHSIGGCIRKSTFGPSFVACMYPNSGLSCGTGARVFWVFSWRAPTNPAKTCNLQALATSTSLVGTSNRAGASEYGLNIQVSVALSLSKMINPLQPRILGLASFGFTDFLIR